MEHIFLMKFWTSLFFMAKSPQTVPHPFSRLFCFPYVLIYKHPFLGQENKFSQDVFRKSDCDHCHLPFFYSLFLTNNSIDCTRHLTRVSIQFPSGRMYISYIHFAHPLDFQNYICSNIFCYLNETFLQRIFFQVTYFLCFYCA